MRRIILGLAMAVGALAPALGQQFPTKEVSIIIPYAPGGATDLVFRAVTFLASPAARHVSGANLVIDGAFTRRVH